MDRIELFSTTPPAVATHLPLQIRVPERYRAELYRAELEQARRSFVAFAKRHPKVQPALAPELGVQGLLEALALLLDDYVAPAIVADVNAYRQQWSSDRDITAETYRRYVAACLQQPGNPYSLSADASTDAPIPTAWPWQGLDAFYRRYPQVRWMVSTMATQFESNIIRCCERVVSDWPDLQAYFFSSIPPAPNTPQIVRLTRIDTTGSDFHKGGGQVLLLGFIDSANAQRRLVYKPTDIERDFRVVGNTAVLAATIGDNPKLTVVTKKGVTRANLLNNQGGNQGRSLAEMVNELGQDQDPKIPTYRILPVYPGSSLAAADGGFPIRESYGYLEFLSYGEADNRLDGEQATTYYRSLGAAVAVCYAFQVTDLHQENLIVHQRMPHLIDLEMAYTGIMPLPSNTNLSAAYGTFEVGIAQREVQGWRTPSLFYAPTGTNEPTKNRLFDEHGAPRAVTMTDNNALRAGFGATFNLIAFNQNAFDIWATSASRMITRILPFGTDLLLGQLRTFNDQQEPTRAVTFPKEIELRTHDNGRVEVSTWGDTFYDVLVRNNLNTPLLLSQGYAPIAPTFAFWLDPQTSNDFIHGDVPSYYQRTGTGEAMGSLGRFVPVSFGLGVQRTAAANRQDLSTRLIALWGTPTPLLPQQYFTGPVFQTWRAYLQQLNSDPQFFQRRLDASLNDLLRWR